MFILEGQEANTFSHHGHCLDHQWRIKISLIYCKYGVKQGCKISGFLFILVIEMIIETQQDTVNMIVDLYIRNYITFVML